MAFRRQHNRAARRAEISTSTVEVVYGSGSAPTLQPQVVPIPTWTSSSGRWYYDLAHGLGRNEVVTLLYDTHTNEYINYDQLEPLTPDTPGTLRIWLTWNPAADRVRVLYF